MVLAGSLCAASNSNTKNSNAYTGVLPQGEKVLLDETFVVAKDYNSKPLVIDKVLVTNIPGSNGQCKLQINSTRYEHSEGKENGFTILIAKDTIKNSSQRTHTFLCPSAYSSTFTDLFRYVEGPRNISNPDDEIRIYVQSSSSSTAINSRETVLSYSKTTDFFLEPTTSDNNGNLKHSFRPQFFVQTSFKDSL